MRIPLMKNLSGRGQKSGRGSRSAEGKEIMDCATFTACIPAFLEDSLDDDMLDAFLAHRRSCSACAEELSIRVLIDRGLAKLDTGENFHLRNELNGIEKNAREAKAHRLFLSRIAYFLEAAAITAAVIVFLRYLTI